MAQLVAMIGSSVRSFEPVGHLICLFIRINRSCQRMYPSEPSWAGDWKRCCIMARLLVVLE